jgi:2-phosphosulfolactate phosphatase
MHGDQSGFDIRVECGQRGMAAILTDCDAVIIVDVLSFSTAVDIATARGARIFPYPTKDASAASFARLHSAILASPQRDAAPGEFSLSPQSLLRIPPGTQLVLHSPNGAALSSNTGQIPTFAACLRNCQAVATHANRLGKRISIIAAGERWDDGTLRPALEDWIGAGAVVGHLQGSRSPEASAVAALFKSIGGQLRATIRDCTSGRELIDRGFAADVELACELNVSHAVPLIRNGAFEDAAGT